MYRQKGRPSLHSDFTIQVAPTHNELILIVYYYFAYFEAWIYCIFHVILINVIFCYKFINAVCFITLLLLVDAKKRKYLYLFLAACLLWIATFPSLRV